MSRVEPNRNVYVGHRYVPKIFGEWDQQNEYEGLSIVTHQGASYTSKKRVPVGIDILNEEFWVVTGNYNAQVEYYRQETERVSNDLELKSDQTYVDTELGKKSDKTYVDNELDKKSDITYVDNELNNNILEQEIFKEKIENNVTYVEDYERLSEENSDSFRIQRAINEAGEYGTLIFKSYTNYDITQPINILPNQNIFGVETILRGDGNNIGFLLQGQETGSRSGININYMRFTNFKTAIKMSSDDINNHGAYYNNVFMCRFDNNDIGVHMGRNCNINNVMSSTFSLNSDVHIKIDNGAYKNNIVFNSIEAPSQSIGIEDVGRETSIDGNYLEGLQTGINSGNIIGNNYFSQISGKNIEHNNYTVYSGKLPSNAPSYPFYPYTQYGNLRIIYGSDQIIIDDLNDSKTNIKVPINVTLDKDLTAEGIIWPKAGLKLPRLKTVDRPVNPPNNTTIIDEDLMQIIWWTSSHWRNAMGETV